MLRHLFDHIKNEKLKVNCLFCSKVFGTVSSLKSHFYRHHSRKDLAATKFSTQPINSNETIHIESLDKENDVNENLTDNTNNIKPVSSYFLASLLLVATHHQNSDFHNVLCKIRRKTKYRIHLSLELLNFIIFLFHATIF
jgi:hypothetical protein